MRKMMTLILLLCSGQLLAQTIYYVKPTGSDANDGSTWATAFQTLQKALSVSVSGSTVWVAAGTYYPDEGPGQDNNGRVSTFKLRNGEALYGGFSGTETTLGQRNLVLNETILSGDLLKDDTPSWGNSDDNAWHVVSTSSDVTRSTILDGFTITAGNAGTILHPNGGGMYNEQSSPTIRNCRFTANQANRLGGGMYNDGVASHYGQHAPLLINCIFTGNKADYGGAIYNSWADGDIINCTFSGNKANQSGGAIGSNNYDDIVQFTNCILWGNTPNGADGYYAISYSLVQGGWSGTGNLNADPLFTGNLHLQGCSPALNTGNNAAVSSYTTMDGDGNTRIMLGRVDMGAYEVQQAGVGGIIYVWATAPAGGDGSSWARAYNKLQDALAHAPLCNLPTQVWVAAGTYYPDEGGGQVDNNRAASFVLENNVALYGGFAGTEKALSQRNLVINTSLLNGDIDHTDGSDNSGNTYQVVRASYVGATAVLDGFTITGGNANGADPYDKGGGLYNDQGSPMISNCIITENTALSFGGGMYNTFASPTLTRCTFTGNTSVQFGGGGLANKEYSSPTISHCSFRNNRAEEGGGMYNYFNCSPQVTQSIFANNQVHTDGGGVFNYLATPHFTNCLFSENGANTGGGMSNFEASATLVHCTFTGNTASHEGGAFYLSASHPYYLLTLTNSIVWGNSSAITNHAPAAPQVTYSIVQGGWPGNLDADPMFVRGGDGRLKGCSPAINSATPTGAPATDIEDKPRPALGGYDMGAYEYQDEGPGTVLYVNKAATGRNDGTSWTNAYTRLQDALTKAGTCYSTTQVWVTAGTYYPDEGGGMTDNDRTASFVLSNNTRVYGGFAGTEYDTSERNWRTHETILSGDIDGLAGNSGNAYHVVRAERVNTTAVLDGFTITGGNADGTLFYLENCDIGGGLFIYDAAPTIAHCSFRSNHAISFGGAVGNMYTYDLVLTNCLFYDNSAKWGGAIAHDDYASSTVINCSFSGNRAEKGGAIYSMNASPQVTNSILWGNTGGQIEASHSARVNYSIVQDGYYPGAGNLSADPLFVRADTGNLHLQACSPAIDAGNKEAITAATDLDGQPRTVVAQTDMGAYEFQGTIIYVKKDATGRANGTSWANAYTSLQDALAQPTGCARLVTIWVAKGTYYPDEGVGLTNNNRSLSFQLRNHTAILGGFAGTEVSLSERIPASARYYETILSGEIDGVAGNAGNSYHVVQSVGVDSSAFLESVTITGGNANGSTTPYNWGGGLYNNSTPTLRYCLFNANNATNGGAVYNTAAASIINCRFTQNRAAYGGAIYNAGASSSILNGLFWKNTATSQGGAIYNTAASPRVINGSFNSNTAPSGYGGALRNVAASAPTVTNSILWGDSGGEISNASSTPVVSYSIVQGGYAGGSNILNADPRFADITTGKLSLTNFPTPSPAIDTGNNAAVTLTTDVYGDQRIYNNIVDMGADEFYPGGIGGPDVLTLTCPQDFTLQSSPGSCGAVADYSGAHAATTTGGEPPVTLTYDPAPGTLLPLGDVLVTVTAKDALVTRTCSFWITVVDTVPPVITGVRATPSLLYPPNHQLQEVYVGYTVADSCAVATLSVSSNEPQYGSGSGDTGPDWQIIDDHTVRLRAERSGKGSDRVYTITITAKDASGNESTATTAVTVPHDKGAPVTTSGAVPAQEVNTLSVSAAPNPSSGSFTLTVQSPSDLPVTIRVMDATGKVMERKEGVTANGTLRIGSSYRPGVYYLQVVQGPVRQTLKLVKQE